MERAKSVRRVERRGGRRPGAGKPPGSVSEAKRVARARASMAGKLPHELLLEWAQTGTMTIGKDTVDLDPQQRMYAASACAGYYAAKLQPRQAPGQQAPTYNLTVDERLLTTLARRSPDKLDVLREVLKLVQEGGPALDRAKSQRPPGDAARYGDSLRPDSPTEGRA